jgi:hypothetical protein
VDRGARRIGGDVEHHRPVGRLRQRAVDPQADAGEQRRAEGAGLGLAGHLHRGAEQVGLELHPPVGPGAAAGDPAAPDGASLRNLAIGILQAHGDRNIAAALRRNARDATRVLPLLGITSP